MSFKLFNSDSTGDVVYGRKVVNSIIALAAQEISGVAGLQGKGFRTEIDGNSIVVDVFIDVYMGESCPDIAFKVQENIKRNIESMTSFKVNVINVNILGIAYKQGMPEKGML